MNRRDFMKAALLVPLALATKIQETRSAEDILLEIVNQPGWTSGDQVFCFSSSEAFTEIGRNMVQGYVEGIEKPVSSMVITYYDHTDWEKVRWDDIPEVLPEVEFEFKPLGPARKMIVI